MSNAGKRCRIGGIDNLSAEIPEDALVVHEHESHQT